MSFKYSNSLILKNPAINHSMLFLEKVELFQKVMQANEYKF